MKSFALAAAAVLTACGLGPDLRESVHQTLPASGTAVVHVTNVVGEVRVSPWKRNAVDINATKFGHSMADLNRVAIDARSDSGNVTIATKYSGGSGGGGVSYTLQVPENASLEIENVTGTVALEGVLGNVSATTQTGEITARLGRVAGNRTVDLGATTGSIKLSIAPDSSARIDASSIIGSFSSDFPDISTNRSNVVGTTATGTVGSGSATIRLHATTGSIVLREAR
jgi:Putative adhesin